MSERLRVLTVLNALTLAGAERLGCDLAAALAQDFDVQLVALRDVNVSQAEQLRAMLTEAGVRCYELHKRPGPRLDTFRQLRKVMDRFRPHVLHTHSTSADFYGGLAVRGRKNLRWVSTLHNKQIFPRFERVGRSVDRALFRRVDAVVGISDYTLNWGRDNYALPQERFHTILSAVDVARFQRASTDRETIRRQYEVPEGALWAVMVGNRSAFKGVDVAVEAARQLQAQGTQAFFLTSIGGEHIDPAYSDDLRQQLRDEPDLPCQLRPPSDDIPSILRAADLFLMPSRMEGLPVALLEAQAAGLACVASSVGAVEEVISDGVNGLVVPAEDAAALAAAWGRLLDDVDLRERCAAAAAERAANEFTGARMAREYAALFRQLVDP